MKDLENKVAIITGMIYIKIELYTQQKVIFMGKFY